MKTQNGYLIIFLIGMVVVNACSLPSSIPFLQPTVTLTPTPSPTMTATATPPPTVTQPPRKQGLIAFYTQLSDVNSGIYVINVDGSDEAIMLSAHPTGDSKPTWSPDGSKIAFESLRDDVANQKYMDIYMMNADGSQLTKLTNTDSWYAHPDWSPIGSQIALTSDIQEDGNADIYLLDVETKELHRLTNDPAQEGQASWSPDGSRIVYVLTESDHRNIFSMDIETGERVQLTEGDGDNFAPDWSPDGQKILFVSKRDGDAEIYVMDANGANQKRVTQTPGADVNPEWSPDGNYFAYTHESSQNGKIYVSDLNGSSPELLYENMGRYAGYPSWSASAVLSDEPVFGPASCASDTNGDLKLDYITNTFTTKEAYPYVIFPYRNMSPDLTTSIIWDYEKKDADTLNMALAWKYNESGWYIAFAGGLPLSTVGPDIVTIQLKIGDQLMQEITCEVVSPEQSSASTNTEQSKKTIWVAAYTYDPENWSDGKHIYHFESKSANSNDVSPEYTVKVSSSATVHDGYVLLRPKNMLAKINGVCSTVDAVHPGQLTRFHVGYTTEKEMTYEDALSFFENLDARVFWDNGNSAKLVYHEILVFQTDEWTADICTYTTTKK
ncbi:MAG: DPP IV N-terminal domain-containing protein [Anaerolineales bacterium]